MSDILRGDNLTCIRGDRPVFSDLAFDLPPGRALVLSGPNGSGKSSLMKIIAGLLPAQQGSITSCHDDILDNILGDRDWISQNICYLAHKNSLKAEMTVAENLAFWASLEHFDGDIGEKAALIGIDHCLDLPVCYLSSGQARRAALARVLCHPGKIWLLDEPTVGLDSAGVGLLAELMDGHLCGGGRILAATHIGLGLDPQKTGQLNMQDFRSRRQTSPQEAPLW